MRVRRSRQRLGQVKLDGIEEVIEEKGKGRGKVKEKKKERRRGKLN